MSKMVIRDEILRAKDAIEKAGLYIATSKDLERLADVSADAYQDYPLHNWFTKGTYDYETSKLLMLVTLKSMLNEAVIYADSAELNGFAVWLPSGFTGNKTLPFIMSGGLKFILHSGVGVIGRLLTYENYAMKLKKEYTGNEDWYLFNLSIKKSAQGKGIASKLLNPMLEFCDAEKMPAYLETNKESNVKLYQHYGFELKKEEYIPGTTVSHYAMVKGLKNTEM